MLADAGRGEVEIMLSRSTLRRYGCSGVIGAAAGAGLTLIWIGGIALVAQGPLTSGDEGIGIAAIILVLGFPSNVMFAILYETISHRSGLGAVNGVGGGLAILFQWGGIGILAQWAADRLRRP